jgi:hypothetical protein
LPRKKKARLFCHALHQNDGGRIGQFDGADCIESLTACSITREGPVAASPAFVRCGSGMARKRQTRKPTNHAEIRIAALRT